jgi:hypothetical protein
VKFMTYDARGACGPDPTRPATARFGGESSASRARPELAPRWRPGETTAKRGGIPRRDEHDRALHPRSRARPCRDGRTSVPLSSTTGRYGTREAVEAPWRLRRLPPLSPGPVFGMALEAV